MRTADVDILVVPGWSSSGPNHWQSRWERSLKTARRVEQDDWFSPRRDPWVAAIVAQARAATRPVVIVAHSLGVIAAVHAIHELGPTGVSGAFLVAPADVDDADNWPTPDGHQIGTSTGFAPIPLQLLPCPSVLVASTTDPFCTFARADDLARAWGARLQDAGDAGHINVASGHGPWPDGLLQFGGLLRALSRETTSG
jgi:uncharacterized protein